MKLKIIGFAVLSLVVLSCASKSSTVASTSTKETKASAPAQDPKASAATKAQAEGPKPRPMPNVAEGKSLYENNCAKCHKLFEAKEFSKEEWGPILVRMQKKAHLSDDEMAGISNYIYTQL